LEKGAERDKGFSAPFLLYGEIMRGKRKVEEIIRTDALRRAMPCFFSSPIRLPLNFYSISIGFNSKED